MAAGGDKCEVGNHSKRGQRQCCQLNDLGVLNVSRHLYDIHSSAPLTYPHHTSNDTQSIDGCCDAFSSSSSLASLKRDQPPTASAHT